LAGELIFERKFKIMKFSSETSFDESIILLPDLSTYFTLGALIGFVAFYGMLFDCGYSFVLSAGLKSHQGKK